MTELQRQDLGIHREERTSLHFIENKLSMDKMKFIERIDISQSVKTKLTYPILAN